MKARAVAILGGATAALLLPLAPALAHQGHRATTTTMTPTTTAPPALDGTDDQPIGQPGDQHGETGLVVTIPETVHLGDTVRIEAMLMDETGQPIEDALITFSSPAAWGRLFTGEMVIGSTRTDDSGRAVLAVPMRRAGDIVVHARFAGDRDHEAIESDPASVAVEGSDQLVRPEVGLDIPWLGAWLLMVVVGGIWVLYIVATRHLSRLARAGSRSAGADAPSPEGIGSRRRFLRAAVPTAMTAALATMGGGIVAIITRSPRTHGNLRADPSGYTRTPFARVGEASEPEPLPPILEREVSFARDVTPILMKRGGPHATAPQHSPPPAGVRFDSYEAIMAMDGLVVPGKPAESLLVQVLVDPAMRMPPSLPPLPEEEIQIIASWVAQGARPT